jgi:hypothetical protein
MILARLSRPYKNMFIFRNKIDYDAVIDATTVILTLFFPFKFSLSPKAFLRLK